MGYGAGEFLSHLDWKQIGDPKFKLYAFQRQSEGEFSDIQLTPDWEPFKYTGSSVYISGTIQSPNGAVHGIAMCKNNDCSESTAYYWGSNSKGEKGYYTQGVSAPLDIVPLTEKEKNENPPITLFWNYGTCGYNKTYSTTWNYIKDKKGIPLSDIEEKGVIYEKERIRCVGGQGSTVIDDALCQGKDISEINKGDTKVLSIIDSNDKSIIIKTINETDLCSLRLLKYNELLKLFNKLASDNTIANGKENAIVKLVQVVKTEHFKEFLTLLQADNNKILKNLMFKVDDQTAFYGSDNYTALVRLFGQMFNEVNKETIKNISNDQLKTFTVIQNSYLTPSNGEKIFQIYFQHNQPEFRISQGAWEVTRNCEWKSGFEECTITQRVKYEEPVFIKPFDMIVLAEDADYNLVNGISDNSKTVPVVPSLFLYYAHSKGEVENIKAYLQNSLDIVTLAVPVTKLATGPRWLAKTFTFVDKWGKVNAAANLAINNSELNRIPELQATLEAYNAVTAAMNVTTLVGAIGKGQIAKLFNELDNPTAKNVLVDQAKKGNKDAQKILDVEAELKPYSEAKEGKNWWKNVDDVVTPNIGKYSLEAISKEIGFIDLLPNLLKREGLSMDDFHYMMQKNVNALTEIEKTKLINIRKALPKPDANTLMQKVVTKDVMQKYLNGSYNDVGGSVAIASDTKHLKTFEDYYHGLRLDYKNYRGKYNFYIEDGSCGVIRFKSDKVAQEIVIPQGGSFDDWDYPFTSTGFTSGNNSRLGVPEWNLPNRIKFKEGDEIWEVFNDGSEKLRAVYKKNKNGILTFIKIGNDK